MTSCITTRTAHHIKYTPIYAEQDMSYEMTKAKHQSQHNADLDKLVSAY